MGVFDRGWMELLQAGGMSYVRARRLTKRLCNVIRESRAEIARARNERMRRERQRSRAAQELELNEAVRQLHARDEEATVTLERLLEGTRRELVPPTYLATLGSGALHERELVSSARPVRPVTKANTTK